MAQTILDLPPAPSGAMLERIVDDGRAWTAADVDPQGCIVELSEAALAEALALGDKLDGEAETPLDANLAIPALRTAMATVKARLEAPPGVAVLDRLPLDDLGDDRAVALFWLLGQLVGRPVPQKWDGTLLYHVRDTGQAYGYGVRGSWTNVELVFHTDNAFAVAPPEAVGLLCLRPALRGGVSRFCSLYSLHNRLLARHPDLLARLYQPLLWDRQAEHAPGGPKIARAPMFAWDGQSLSARLNVSLVRKGYQAAAIEIDSQAAAALDAVAAATDDPDLWFELPIERGQIQYLDNRDLVHYRSHFTDHEDPALRRHLVRTWHREADGPGYDG